MNKYLYILDFERGICEVFNIFDNDPEEWMSYRGYHFDNIEWMVTEDINLHIDI